MRASRIISLFVLLALTVLSKDVRAQLCPPNMLTIPEEGGWVSMADDQAVKLSGAFTIEMWVKLVSAAERSTIIEKGNGGEFINYSIALGPQSTIVARVLTPTGVLTLNSEPVPNITAWHHYALVYKPGDSLYLYVDGEQAGSARAQAQSLVVGNDDLRIGTSRLEGSRNLYGSIDEVRIWKIARTQTQLKSYDDVVIDPNSAGLSAYFSFDDNTTPSGLFFENKRRVARLNSHAFFTTSTSPVKGRAVPYKLQAKESIVRLPSRACITQYDTVVRVRNLWLDSINVNQMGLRKGGAFSIAGPAKLVLPPDSNFYGEIRIQFNPTVSGIYTDTIVISSNTPCAGQILIPIIDTFVATGFRIAEQNVHVGTLLNCALPVNRRITLRNIGSEPLSITRANWSSEIHAEVTTKLPLLIGPGQSSQLTIQFNPGPDGALTSELSFESDVCSRSAAIPVSITRESISFTHDEEVEFGERVILSSIVSVDTVITFTNSSDRALLLTGASVSGSSSFTVQPSFDPVTLAAGESIEIPVRFRALVCGNYTGTLRIFGNPCNVDARIPLHAVVTGPKPTMPSIIDVGFNCGPRDTTIALYNPYDSVITFTGFNFSSPGVFSTSTPFPITIQPYRTDSLKLRFAPAQDREYEVDFTMSNAKCGALVVKLRGSRGTTSVAVAPNVDFGRGCDLTPLRRPVKVTNSSPREVVITRAEVLSNSRFSFVDNDLPLSIPPGESADLFAEFTPESNARHEGVAQFTIAGGCKTSTSMLYGTREEPILAVNASVMDFDTVCPSFTRVVDALVNNLGLDSVNPQYRFTVGVAYSLASPLTAFKRGQNTLQVRFAPLTTESYRDTLVIFVPGCENEYRIALTGSGGSDPSLSYSRNELAFGDVEISTSAERCVTITNTSCTPIILDVSSFSLDNAKYRIKQTSIDGLPRVLSNNEAFELCMTYHPSGRVQDLAQLTINAAGVEQKIVQLSGRGIAPDFALSDTVLDFGFVPVSDDRDKSFTVSNFGELDGSITLTLDPAVAEFTVGGSTVTIEAGTSKEINIEFKPTAALEYESTLQITGGNQPMSVALRGIGIQRGLVVDRTVMDFGDVRVGTSKTETFEISANVFPTILTDVTLAAGGNGAYYEITLDASTPCVFKTASHLVTATITFTPTLEAQLDHSLQVISESGQTLTIDLAGRGVDAHIVAPDTLRFERAPLETTTFQTYTIENTGLYPLTVTSTNTQRPFESASVPTVIAPGSTRTFSIGFTPEVISEVQGELRITSDAAEGERVIVLLGSGGDVAPGKRHVRYELRDTDAEIGEQVTIPVMISHGQLLEELKTDSFYVEIKYDPWMLYLHGSDAFNSVTNGMSIQSKKVTDSTFAVWGKGAFDLEVGKPLIELKGEALFGPRETTQMQIVTAYPFSSVATLAEPFANFTVTNCHDQTAAAIYKGAYAVQQAFPTPSRTAATIEYTLGFMGGAEIEIVDALGRTVRRVNLPEKPKGEHTYTLDVSDLPNGHYFGLFRSREFLKRIDLVIEH